MSKQINNEIRFRAVLDASGAIKGYEEIKDMEAVTREAAERPIQLYLQIEGADGTLQMVRAELLGVQETAERPVQMDIRPPDLEPARAEIESVQEKAAEPVQVRVEAQIDEKTQKAIEEMQQKLQGEIRYQLIVDPTTGDETLKRFEATAEEMRQATEKPIQLYTLAPNMKAAEAELLDFRQKAEEPIKMDFDVEAAVAGIRDLTIIVNGAISAMKSLVTAANELLDSAHTQRRAMTVTKLAFGEAANEVAKYAASMQDVTNYADHQLLPLMSKMAMAYKLNKDEVMQLTPFLLDFAEAHKATGMTVERAFDLMGRALMGHTEMLGRAGIELDKTRLAADGVSYLIEKLGKDYGGTAEALADLRLQNAVAWGEIKETVGEMLHTIINPVLQGLKYLMDAYNNLSPIMKGFVTGLTVAIPVIVTTTTVIAALTAAVHALKAAISPTAAVIGIVVGALTALTFGLAAAMTKTEEVTTAQKSLKDEIKDAERHVATEAERFRILSSRLLELRSATSLTIADKKEMRNIIRSLNRDYGEYLGNIDLETASYDQLAAAITAASEALVSKKIAEVYGERYNAKIKEVAELQIALNEMQEEYDKALQRRLKIGTTAVSDATSWGHNYKPYTDEAQLQYAQGVVDRYDKLRNSLQASQNELREFAEAYRKAMLEAPDLTFDPASKGGGTSRVKSGASTDSELERRRKEAIRLMEELSNLRLTETARIQQEYDRRLALIKEFTEEESKTQKTAIYDLNAWKRDQDNTLKEKQLKAEIDYYATLEGLGVDSYENQRSAMTQYYLWALLHLTKKEQELIMAQRNQLDARHAERQEELRRAAEKEREEELAHLQEMEDIRHDFRVRDLELNDKFYQAELMALDKYYADRKKKLLEAGLTEEEIESQRLMAMRDLRMAHDQQNASQISNFLGNLADMQNQDSKKGFKRWQALAIAQAGVDTFTAAISAYKAMVGIPLIGPALAAAAAAAAVAAGLANMERIRNMKYEPQQYATGGIIRGKSHREGGVLIEAEGDEYITAKDRVKALGRNLFDFLNFAPLGQVKLALAGLPVPSVPVRQVTSTQYASGGSVQSGLSLSDMSQMMATVKDELVKLRQAVTESRPMFEINVDPLSNDPVKVSEIAETGKLLRSEV